MFGVPGFPSTLRAKLRAGSAFSRTFAGEMLRSCKGLSAKRPRRLGKLSKKPAAAGKAATRCLIVTYEFGRKPVRRRILFGTPFAMRRLRTVPRAARFLPYAARSKLNESFRFGRVCGWGYWNTSWSVRSKDRWRVRKWRPVRCEETCEPVPRTTMPSSSRSTMHRSRRCAT